MKKTSRKRSDELRPEYDLSNLKGGVRGKYYQQAIAGTNLVLIEPALNRALRLLAETAEAATTKRRRGSRMPNKRLKRTA